MKKKFLQKAAGESAGAERPAQRIHSRFFLYCLLLMAMALSNGAFAQNFQWAKRMGAYLPEAGDAITLDNAGNVYTTGLYQATVDFDPGPGVFNLFAGSGSALFIQKLDAAGNFVWAESIGGGGGDDNFAEADGIALDPAGNVYVSGTFTGAVDFDPGPGTFVMSDGNFILKLNNTGNFVWAKNIAYCSGKNSIAVDAAGNVYTTSIFEQTTDFDPGAGVFNLTSSGWFDVYVLKLNTSGNFIWAKSMGGPGTDLPNSIAVDAMGNVCTTGSFSGTSDFDPGAAIFNIVSAGLYDIFVSKLDAAGNFVWAKSMVGANSSDAGNSISTDGAGNIYTTGSFGATVDFDPGAGVYNLVSAGASDIFISKLDASGNFVWAKRIGGTGTDYSTCLTVDGCDNVYTTGSFISTVDFDPNAGTVNLTSAGLQDIFISKLDASGNFAGARNMGGIYNENAFSIAVNASGRICTTGQFNGTADFDPGIGVYNLTPAGTNDIFVSALDDVNPCCDASCTTNLAVYTGSKLGSSYSCGGIIGLECGSENVFSPNLSCAASQVTSIISASLLNVVGHTPSWAAAFLANQGNGSLVIPATTAGNFTLTYYWGINNQVCDSCSYTIAITCIDCKPCKRAIAGNLSFQNIPVSGGSDISHTPSADWFATKNSPQYDPAMGCCDNGYVLMWGNKATGEQITQTGINIIAGHQYKISFCGRFGGASASAYVRFRFTASNSIPSGYGSNIAGGVAMGLSAPVSSTTFNTYTLPVWTATSNFSVISINPENQYNINNGNYVSWGHLDNLCIKDITQNCAPVYVNAGPDVTSSCCSPVQLNAGVSGSAGPYTYNWSPTVGLSNSNIANPIASQSGTYIVTVTSVCGSMAKDTVMVTIHGGDCCRSANNMNVKASAFPNPFNNSFRIDGLQNRTADLEILTLQGTSMLQYKNVLGCNSFGGSLQKGMYILHVIFKDGTTQNIQLIKN